MMEDKEMEALKKGAIREKIEQLKKDIKAQYISIQEHEENNEHEIKTHIGMIKDFREKIEKLESLL